MENKISIEMMGRTNGSAIDMKKMAIPKLTPLYWY